MEILFIVVLSTEGLVIVDFFVWGFCPLCFCPLGFFYLLGLFPCGFVRRIWSVGVLSTRGFINWGFWTIGFLFVGFTLLGV